MNDLVLFIFIIRLWVAFVKNRTTKIKILILLFFVLLLRSNAESITGTCILWFLQGANIYKLLENYTQIICPFCYPYYNLSPITHDCLITREILVVTWSFISNLLSSAEFGGIIICTGPVECNITLLCFIWMVREKDFILNLLFLWPTDQ